MRYILTAILLVAASFAVALDLTGRVVDDARLLSTERKQALEATLAAHERATTNQIVIVTVKSLDGKPIEDFGYQLGRQWGIGTKNKNNGVMLIVAPAEREVRIEVGYGLEGVLTDAESRMIIERMIVPEFKKGDMEEGIVQGTRGIIQALGGELSVPEPYGGDSDFFSGFGSFLLIGVLIFFSLVFRLIFGGRGRGGRGGGFWSSGGWGGGGGTFGGGGGSFGGGGASGKW